MTTWWLSRQPRERWVLGGSGVVLLMVLLYLLVWEPWHHNMQRLRSDVAALGADLVWMQQAAVQLRQVQGTGRTTATSTPRSGMALATQTEQAARAAGLDTALRRIEPQSDGRLRLWLEQVGFATLLPWLIDLRYEQGVYIDDIQLERSNSLQGDVVNARLTLRGQ